MGALWGRPFSDQPSKVLSTEASSRARATPVEGERGKPTLVEAKHQEGKEGRRLTGRRGFSCPQDKAAPATPMEGGEGKLLARMSLAQGSLAASLVGNNNTVAAAATTASPSTTTTTRASTRTRVLVTRITGDASATTA